MPRRSPVKVLSTVWRVKAGVESVAARPCYIRSRFHSRPRQNPDALLHCLPFTLTFCFWVTVSTGTSPLPGKRPEADGHCCDIRSESQPGVGLAHCLTVHSEARLLRLAEPLGKIPEVPRQHQPCRPGSHQPIAGNDKQSDQRVRAASNEKEISHGRVSWQTR